MARTADCFYETAQKIKVSTEADVVVVYNTFVGVAPLVGINDGTEPNTTSRFYKETGLKLQIKQVDIADDALAALKSGVVDAIYCTTDALPIGMSQGSTLQELGVKEIFKVNESRGADAIVVTSAIKSVADLKGKKIAYSPGTASNTLLINVLETAGLSMSDVELYKVNDGIEAATAFKNKACDAGVMWAPDDGDAVKAIPGSRVLVSTKTATQIIADGLLVTAQNAEAKREQLLKLIKAWMKANGEANESPTFRKKCGSVFASAFGVDAAVVDGSLDKVRYSNLTDNKTFFGFDPTYTGVTGEKMYGRMSVKYVQAGLAKAPAPWSKVSDGSFIEMLLGDNALAQSQGQGPETQVKFVPPTKADETVAANSSKSLTVNFATNSFELDEQAKNIIEREVTGSAQGFREARVRIEGNTDNTGNAAANKQLSLRRAAAVKAYLVSEHGFDPNKFIVVGNGPDKPVSDNSTEAGKAANRRTDFQFLW